MQTITQHIGLNNDEFDISYDNGSITFYVDVFFPLHCKDFHQIWLYISVTQRVFYKEPELLTLLEGGIDVYPRFFSEVHVAHFFIAFCVVLLYVFMFCVLCCGVRYDLRIKTMFSSSTSSCLYYCITCLIYVTCVCLFVQHILCCVFAFRGLVYPMLPVSLDCPIFLCSFGIFEI